MALAALFLGSNLGDRAGLLAEGRRLLGECAAFVVVASSSVYETEPVECPPQPWFLNQVLLGECPLSPEALLAVALGVENSLGRVREEHRGPRTLDVDLLFVGASVCGSERLTLPHPALARRRCVLVPLADVAPDWRHPVLGATVAELLARCPDTALVRPFSPSPG